MILLGANEPVSSVEECSKSMANFKSTPYPRQESEDDRDTNGKLKPGAGIPRQEEHAQGSKESTQAELDAKSDARIPSQEEGNDENDEVSKASHHLPCQERSIDSEDVFYSAGIEAISSSFSVKLYLASKHKLAPHCYKVMYQTQGRVFHQISKHCEVS